MLAAAEAGEALASNPGRFNISLYLLSSSAMLCDRVDETARPAARLRHGTAPEYMLGWQGGYLGRPVREE